jgi:hypothetical protein
VWGSRVGGEGRFVRGPGRVWFWAIAGMTVTTKVKTIAMVARLRNSSFSFVGKIVGQIVIVDLENFAFHIVVDPGPPGLKALAPIRI